MAVAEEEEEEETAARAAAHAASLGSSEGGALPEEGGTNVPAGMKPEDIVLYAVCCGCVMLVGGRAR